MRNEVRNEVVAELMTEHSDSHGWVLNDN